MKKDNLYPYKIKQNYNFEKVEIFLRVKGRLPNKKDDCLSQKILDDFCTLYKNGKLKKGVMDLNYLYSLIKDKTIIAQLN